MARGTLWPPCRELPQAPALDHAEQRCLLTRSRKLEAVDGGPSASGEAEEAEVAEVRAQYMGVAEKVAGMLRAQGAGT
eukprot:COSAG04_NODE_2625_length_3838_cov_2.524472_2_plen_78_part_00